MMIRRSAWSLISARNAAIVDRAAAGVACLAAGAVRAVAVGAGACEQRGAAFGGGGAELQTCRRATDTEARRRRRRFARFVVIGWPMRLQTRRQ